MLKLMYILQYVYLVDLHDHSVRLCVCYKMSVLSSLYTVTSVVAILLGRPLLHFTTHF